MNRFTSALWTVAFAVVATIIISCTPVSQATTAFSCSFNGTVTSGDATLTESLTVSNVVVSIYGAMDNGPFAVTLPTIPQTPPVTATSATYSIAGPVTVANGAAVVVVDTAANLTTSCPVSLGTTTQSTGGSDTIGVSITPSQGYLTTTSGTVILDVTSLNGIINPLFAFSLVSTPAGVSLQKVSNTEAKLVSISTVPVTVNVNITEYASDGVSAVGSAQQTVCFGASSCDPGSGAMVSFTANAYSAPVGTYLTLTATPSGIIQPTFTYNLVSGNSSGLYDWSPSGFPNVVNVTSTIATTLTIEVIATSSADATSASSTATVSFY